MNPYSTNPSNEIEPVSKKYGKLDPIFDALIDFSGSGILGFSALHTLGFHNYADEGSIPIALLGAYFAYKNSKNK